MAPKRGRGNRVLRFAVSGALLVAAPTACSDDDGGSEEVIGINEPDPNDRPPHHELRTNEPGPMRDEAEPTAPDGEDEVDDGAEATEAPPAEEATE